MIGRFAGRGAVTVALGAWLSVAHMTQAAQPSPSSVPDVQALGPQVGSRVPDFSLSDQNGDPHTLRSVMGPKGAMLVFFRSADW